MVGWRLFCHSIMLSTRYASILLYPAIICTAWFCFYLRKIAKLLFLYLSNANGQLVDQICAFIPILLITGISVAGLIKILHYNPYGNHTAILCKELEQKNTGRDLRVYTYLASQPLNEHVAQERIAYYSKISKQRILNLLNDQDGNWQDVLINRIKDTSNSFKDFFFVFYLRNGETEPVTRFIKMHPELGTWNCLQSEYTSPKKNKRINLYRFIPAHPNMDEWNVAIPELPADNIIKNGGFETVLSGNRLDKLLEYYDSVGAPSYSDVNRIFPDNWRFDIGPWNNDNPPDMRLCSDNPLAGKYSLFLDSLHTVRKSGFYSDEIRTQQNNCKYDFFIQNIGQQDAGLWVQIRSWIPEDRKDVIWDGLYFTLDAGKNYRIHSSIDMSLIKVDFFKISITCTGKTILDQFCITKDN